MTSYSRIQHKEYAVKTVKESNLTITIDKTRQSTDTKRIRNVVEAIKATIFNKYQSQTMPFQYYMCIPVKNDTNINSEGPMTQ